MLALLNDDFLPCTMVSMFLTANGVYRCSWGISEQCDVLSLGFQISFCRFVYRCLVLEIVQQNNIVCIDCSVDQYRLDLAKRLASAVSIVE